MNILHKMQLAGILTNPNIRYADKVRLVRTVRALEPHRREEPEPRAGGYEHEFGDGQTGGGL